MSIVFYAVYAALMLGTAIVFIFNWAVFVFMIFSSDTHIPIKEKSGKRWIFAVLCIGLTIYSLIWFAEYEDSSSFTHSVQSIILLILYLSAAVFFFIEAVAVPKAYLTENGIMSFYASYPKDTAKYTLKKEKNKVFIKLYTDGTKPIVSYKISALLLKDHAIPLLDGLYGKFDRTAPAGRNKNYTVRYLAASLTVSLLIIGAASLWYAIEKPVIFVGEKLVRTNSEYAVFDTPYRFLDFNGYYFNFPNYSRRIEYSRKMLAASDETDALTSSDLKHLKEMPYLRHLCLTNNDIDDLTEIGKLTQLEGLYIGGEKRFHGDKEVYKIPEDYSPLKNLTNLRFFAGLGLSNLNDLTVFENSDDLLLFVLTGTDIQKGLDIICSNESLTVLDLSGCTADDYSPVGNCKNLQVLYLRGSNAKDLSFLRNLTNLKILDIDDISAQDYAVLLELPSLEYVRMYVDDLPDEIPEKLEEKGVEVLYYH